MVKLKPVIDPFTSEMMNSISCFSEEKDFYDCVNRKFLDDCPFRNLEYSFYTYLLTGDKEEWIGYVLFSNENRINNYYQFAYENFKTLIAELKILSNKDQEEKISSLIGPKVEISRFKVELERWLEELEIMFPNYSMLFSNFKEKQKDNLKDFPDYFYVDIVIALPKLEEYNLLKENNVTEGANTLVERKYCGFIRETCNLVEKEINNNFAGIPCFLKKDEQTVFVVNPPKTLKKEYV